MSHICLTFNQFFQSLFSHFVFRNFFPWLQEENYIGASSLFVCFPSHIVVVAMRFSCLFSGSLRLLFFVWDECLKALLSFHCIGPERKYTIFLLLLFFFFYSCLLVLLLMCLVLHGLCIPTQQQNKIYACHHLVVILFFLFFSPFFSVINKHVVAVTMLYCTWWISCHCAFNQKIRWSISAAYSTFPNFHWH